uniref:Uncharacterized protein n=1 Tax=Oryza punctata TaxID=4537 RepID=A0A0E0M5C3_ORYPU
MDDGWLGYAGMMGPIVKVFPIEDSYEDGYATWIEVTAIHLDVISDDEMEAILMLAWKFDTKVKKDSNQIPPQPVAIKADNNDEYNRELSDHSYHQVPDWDSDSKTDHEMVDVLMLENASFVPRRKRIEPTTPHLMDNDEYKHVVIRATIPYLVFTYNESNQLSTTMACVYSSITNTWGPMPPWMAHPNSNLVQTELGVFVINTELKDYKQLSQRTNITTAMSTSHMSPHKPLPCKNFIAVLPGYSVSEATPERCPPPWPACESSRTNTVATMDADVAFDFKPAAVLDNADLSPPAMKHRPFVYDVRHYCVHIDDGKDGLLLVWDPLTRRQEVIPTPRCYFTNDNSCVTAMICSCDVPDHDGTGGGDYHSEPYRVVVAFSDLPSFCPDEWNLDRICVRVWSLGTKEWSKVYSMRGSCGLDFKPSIFIASTVHWLVGDIHGVLQFILDTKKLALIQTPVDILEFILFPTKDGKLGFTGVLITWNSVPQVPTLIPTPLGHPNPPPPPPHPHASLSLDLPPAKPPPHRQRRISPPCQPHLRSRPPPPPPPSSPPVPASPPPAPPSSPLVLASSP